MGHSYYGTRLSGRMSTTPEGYLICHSVPVSRTGTMIYRGSEVGMSSLPTVEVHRSAEDVFEPAAMASLEGKPVCGPGHPPRFVDTSNASYLAKGHVQNVRRATDRLATGEEALIADLVVTDPALIDMIRNGMRNISVGYDVEWDRNDDGSLQQSRIRANHVAVVSKGRAGEDIRIYDHCILEDDADADFEGLAKQYHRCDPRTVEVDEFARDLVQDGVVEEMYESARPRRWDDLKRELHSRMGQGDYDDAVKVLRDAEAEDFEDMARAQRERLLGRK